MERVGKTMTEYSAGWTLEDQRESNKKYYHTHPEKMRETHLRMRSPEEKARRAACEKIRRDAHLEEYRARARARNQDPNYRKKTAAYMKNYWATHSESIRANRRIHRYGLSQTAYDVLFKNQGGACAICRKSNWGGRGPIIDHDHKPGGGVRAILCNKCNTALGLIGDDPKIAQAMVIYLKDALAKKTKEGKP